MPKLKARESMDSMTASVIVINGGGVVTCHRPFRLINESIKVVSTRYYAMYAAIDLK